MQKNIYAISMVKNEADVIESFVRYHCAIFDGMIILDNMSTDNTQQILTSLKNEGLPITILKDVDYYYTQYQKVNEMLYSAINEFGGDIIVPLDGDEFLVSTSGGNPRRVLEHIDINKVHLARWKTYIPQHSDDMSKKFVPQRIVHNRDEEVESYFKAIIPRELVLTYKLKLNWGSHDVMVGDAAAGLPPRVISPDLRIAHFPVRSIEQITSKAIVNWLNATLIPTRSPGQCFHLGQMYHGIKKEGVPSYDQLINIAKRYALRDDDKRDVTVTKNAVDISFCGDMIMAYTSDIEVNPLQNILNYTEKIIAEYMTLKYKSK